MNLPDFEGARRFALNRLERELDPRLTYHSLYHTRDDVVPAVERLAAIENITGEELMLLRTAAYYHDIGFTQQRSEHEAVSVAITAEVLPIFRFTEEQIERICSMILATRLPQAPRDLAEQVLTDADLDNLGREDFFTVSVRLRNELANFGSFFADRDWFTRQLGFITSHTYFTAAARSTRDTQKANNITKLKEILQKYPE